MELPHRGGGGRTRAACRAGSESPAAGALAPSLQRLHASTRQRVPRLRLRDGYGKAVRSRPAHTVPHTRGETKRRRNASPPSLGPASISGRLLRRRRGGDGGGSPAVVPLPSSPRGRHGARWGPPPWGHTRSGLGHAGFGHGLAGYTRLYAHLAMGPQRRHSCTRQPRHRRDFCVAISTTTISLHVTNTTSN